jgi:hypothetical protein
VEPHRLKALLVSIPLKCRNGAKFEVAGAAVAAPAAADALGHTPPHPRIRFPLWQRRSDATDALFWISIHMVACMLEFLTFHMQLNLLTCLAVI